jgi:phosphatidylinositol-3-phosphatase
VGRRRSAGAAAALLTATLLVGCAGGAEPRSSEASATPDGTPSARAGGPASASPGRLVRATKVLVVIEENHSYAQMRAGMPFLAALSDTYGYATHWTAITHPSEPNYLAITGGSTFGITDDKPPAAHAAQMRGATSVFDQALESGRTAATYAESMPANCSLDDSSDGVPTYAVRHNPWAYFPAGRHGCLADDENLRQFGRDAAGNALPHVGFLIPDLRNDGHDGSLGTADHWLEDHLAPVLDSRDFTSGKLVVIVTADEDDRHSGNTVLTSVLTPALSHRVVTSPLTHYSLTRYIAEILGVPALREGAGAPDLAAAFGL